VSNLCSTVSATETTTEVPTAAACQCRMTRISRSVQLERAAHTTHIDELAVADAKREHVRRCCAHSIARVLEIRPLETNQRHAIHQL
jgi:hypothetical protein